MIKTILADVKQDVPDQMVCDRCSRVEQIVVLEDGGRYWECDFYPIQAGFGYHSQNDKGESMDLTIYEAVVCDRCFLPAMKAAGIKLHIRGYGGHIPNEELV